MSDVKTYAGIPIETVALKLQTRLDIACKYIREYAAYSDSKGDTFTAMKCRHLAGDLERPITNEPCIVSLRATMN